MKTKDKSKLNLFKDKKNIFIIITILSVIFVALMYNIGFSKNTNKQQGNLKAVTGGLKCSIEVVASEANVNTVNPYCTVTVKNSDENGVVSDVDIDFEVEVVSNENTELHYKWIDSEGIPQTTDTNLTGSIAGVTEASKTYKIIFINDGTQDVTRNVDFKLIAKQKSN